MVLVNAFRNKAITHIEGFPAALVQLLRTDPPPQDTAQCTEVGQKLCIELYFAIEKDKAFAICRHVDRLVTYLRDRTGKNIISASASERLHCFDICELRHDRQKEHKCKLVHFIATWDKFKNSKLFLVNSSKGATEMLMYYIALASVPLDITRLDSDKLAYCKNMAKFYYAAQKDDTDHEEDATIEEELQEVLNLSADTVNPGHLEAKYRVHMEIAHGQRHSDGVFTISHISKLVLASAGVSVLLTLLAIHLGFFDN